MLDHTTQSFSTKEKIEILLKEYDTLRDEIGRKTAGGYQLVIVLAGILTFVLGLASRHGWELRYWLSGTSFVVVLGLIFFRLSRTDTNIIAGRVRDIETEINRMVGSTLLIYESQLGGLRRNCVGSLVGSGDVCERVCRLARKQARKLWIGFRNIFHRFAREPDRYLK